MFGLGYYGKFQMGVHWPRRKEVEEQGSPLPKTLHHPGIS